MKGIAHFISGVAVATLFPEVVQAAADGSVLPTLGGVAGLLPDLLDFRLVRYLETYDLETYDLEVDPGPDPDAGQIAQELAELVGEAYRSGETRSVMLHTIRLGSDRWRRYGIRFDSERGEVLVRVGPIVSTGQVPLPGSEPPGGDEAAVDLEIPLVNTYDREIAVDIFSGPSIKFQQQGGWLHVRFLDWHRRWSHSLNLAAAVGLGAAGVAALAQVAGRAGLTRMPLWVRLVTGLGLTCHILEDQLGSMGSNLIYPLTRGRPPGLGLLHSGDALPNFFTVWIPVMVILFNLDRFSAGPRLRPWWTFLGLTVVLPVLVLGAVYQLQRPGHEPSEAEPLCLDEVYSEVEEADIG